MGCEVMPLKQLMLPKDVETRLLKDANGIILLVSGPSYCENAALVNIKLWKRAKALLDKEEASAKESSG